MAKRLTAKQRRFCEEYLVDLNGTQAAIRSKFSEKSAAEQSYQMLNEPHIKAKIEELQNARSQRTEITADIVLTRVDQMAGFDIAECYDERGALKNIRDIPPHIRAAIAAVETMEVEEFINGHTVKVGEVKKLKFWNKLQANDMLGKHLKIFKDNVDHKHTHTLEDLVGGSHEPNDDPVQQKTTGPKKPKERKNGTI